MNTLEHRAAGDLRPSWLGSRVSVAVRGGTLTGGLSDYGEAGQQIWLFMGGGIVVVTPATTVTRGELDAPGGEGRG